MNDITKAANAYGRISALASERAVHRAFQWLHLHEPQIRQWQVAATSIPAPPFGEAARAAWFCDRFRELGLPHAHVDEEGNALAELPGINTAVDAPVVLLSAHLDTVFPAGTDCTATELEERLLAPGICDNGAGLAGLLALATAMQEAQLRPACTVLFAANVGEEGEGDLRGMRQLFAAESGSRIAAALALEGAGTATVVSRALGSRRLRVTVTGPGGHSWADFGRPNPILAFSSALVTIAKLPLPAQPRSTLNCGVIRGGTSVNSIPASVSADLDLRSVSALQLDQIELAVLGALEKAISQANEAASEGVLRLDVQRIGDRAAGELPEASPLAASLRAVDRHLQLATESRIGSTDANLPLSLGVAALALGAGGTGGGIHTLNEWFEPAGRSLALRRVLLLLLDTCRLVAQGDLQPAGSARTRLLDSEA